MHVFISYAREDFDSVRSVWSLLKEHNIPAWIDEESLLPGQDWEFQIQKAIRECAVFLACLSTNSVVKRGYVQAELKEALNVFRKIPENEVFIIPLRLEPCDLPMSLERLHFVDFFAPNGPTKLLAGINLCMPVAEPSTSQQLLYPDKVTARGLSLAEWAVLNELKGKPDNQIIWVVSRGRLLCSQSLFNFRWIHRDKCNPKPIAAGAPLGETPFMQ